MSAYEIVSNSTLFAGLPEEQLKLIMKIAIQKTYLRGETVFFEGEPANGFYMVSAGKVKIFKLSLTGKEQILHIFGPGEPFGEVPVFHGKPFPANAETLVKSTFIFFPRKEFVELVNENPSIAMSMLAVLSMRLRRFATQIENLSLKEVPERLSGYLLYLMEEQQGTQSVTLEISKGQLASLLGTIPETLSRIFSKMTEEGLIRVEGRVIHIVDKESLSMKTG